MSNQSLANRVQSQLKQAVESGLLPKGEHEKASKLLARLQQPVRLALLGMPLSGKSSLLNLLVGQDVIPQGVRLPTTQVVYGELPQSVCTLPDGSKKILDGADVETISALSPVFVEIQLPLAALTKISVLEIVAPDDPNAIHRASQWAAKRCDVALWCTRGFTEPEQRIWSAMPDLIKDHGFCMVTHSDYLKSQGLYEAAIAAITTAAGDEFNHVLAIATTQAIAARHADGTVDKAQMRESGGSTLISAVLKQVERGRQSAVDTADMLLHQHADVLEKIETRPQPAPEPEKATKAAADVIAPPQPTATEPPAPAPETAKEEAPQVSTPSAEESETKPAAMDAISRLRAIAARKNVSRDAALDDQPEPMDEPAPTPEEPREEPTLETNTPLGPQSRAAYDEAIAYIAKHGAELSKVWDAEGEKGQSEIMAMAATHIQWICDHLNENGDEADPALQRARDTAFDAADLAQLMQMEKRDVAALEAVGLMLQIKRELQADLAA